MDTWNKQDLHGTWHISCKIDGVRLFVHKDRYTSKAGKKLYGIPLELKDGIYELFWDNFKKTIQTVRSYYKYLPLDAVYMISPVIDPRLDLGTHESPTKELIEKLFQIARLEGFEGLVLRSSNNVLKVKPTITHDLLVTNWQPGKGKHEGRMGALVTKLGMVGTGFSDEERNQFTRAFIVGKIIEVEAMQMTSDNKMRHSRFIRLREDRNTESIGTSNDNQDNGRASDSEDDNLSRSDDVAYRNPENTQMAD